MSAQLALFIQPCNTILQFKDIIRSIVLDSYKNTDYQTVVKRDT